MSMCLSYVRWVLTFSFFFVGSVGTQGPIIEVHCPFIFYNNICSNYNWGISDLVLILFCLLHICILHNRQKCPNFLFFPIHPQIGEGEKVG